MQKTENFYIDDRLNEFLLKAVVLHSLLIFLAFIVPSILNISWFNPKKIETTIIQSSVRIDVVAMPKFTVQELKKMKVALPKKEIEMKTEAPKAKVKTEKPVIKKDDIIFKKKAKKVNLGDLLSNLSKKTSKAIKKKTKNSAKAKQYKKELRNLILEGNKVNSGTSLVGDSTAQDNGLFNNYAAGLPNFIRPFWKLPSYLLDKGFQCRVRVYIAASGKILKAELFESSGSTEFDNKALAALKKSNSFPPPGREILPRVASGEVILGFPL